MPKLGKKFEVTFEVVTKPRHEYQTMADAELGLPRAPAIMIGGEVIVEGRDIDEEKFENTAAPSGGKRGRLPFKLAPPVRQG